jgi:hypothetical protein
MPYTDPASEVGIVMNCEGDNTVQEWNTFTQIPDKYTVQLHSYLYLIIYCTSDIAQIKMCHFNTQL